MLYGSGRSSEGVLEGTMGLCQLGSVVVWGVGVASSLFSMG